CDPAQGKLSIYQIDLLSGRTTGPLYFQTDDSRKRDEIKTDLTYTIEDAWGEHQIKSGIEFANESYGDTPTTNPILQSLLRPCTTCRDTNGNPVKNAVKGSQTLTQFSPVSVHQR